MKAVGEDLNDDLHEVFLSEGVLAADHLLKNSREHLLQRLRGNKR